MDAARVAAETVAAIGALETGADVRVGHLGGADDDPAALPPVLARVGGSEPDSSAPSAGDDPPAVVVPLVAGPHPDIDTALRQAVAAAGVPVAVAEPLGPHPLLAEVLHVRLAEAGLARADRIRLVGFTTAADGIVLGTVGGERAARMADAAAVLLAARLAVPVVPAALDGVPDVAAAGARLRQIGATNLALAPYLVGPEVESARLTGAADDIGAKRAGPLGAHPAIAQLIIDRYTDALIAARTGGRPAE